MSVRMLLFFLLFMMNYSCKPKVLSAKELINNGLDAAAAGNYKLADSLFSAAIKRDPWLKKGFYLRGKVRNQMGEYKLAMADLEKTESLLSNGTGYILQKKNILEPEDDYWEVDYHDVVYQKGVAYVYLDSLKQAYHCFRYLINTNFLEKSSCFLWKGEILLATGDSIKACTEFMNAKATARDTADKRLADEYLIHCQGKINADTFLFYRNE